MLLGELIEEQLAVGDRLRLAAVVQPFEVKADIVGHIVAAFTVNGEALGLRNDQVLVELLVVIVLERKTGRVVRADGEEAGRHREARTERIDGPDRKERAATRN